MWWLLRLLWLLLKTFNYLLTHFGWILTLITGCVYFQLWKSFDVLWLFLHLLFAACVPCLRPDVVPFALFYCLRARSACCWRNGDGATCKESIRAIKAPIRDDPPNDEKTVRFRQGLANSFNLGVVLLRLRVSFAMVIGNHHEATLPIGQGPRGTLALLYKVLWVDVATLWLSIIIAVVRQWRLCCRIGCVRYYLWVAIVFAVNFAAMEVPMHYAEKNLDYNWCKFNINTSNGSAASNMLCNFFACVS